MVAILDAVLQLLEDRPFHEIGVEEICERANVSKMTFFRYFGSKEEVLDYFTMRWCFQRSVEIQEGKFHGQAGIRHVFQSASEIPGALKILVALIQYYAKLNEPPAKKELSAYERYYISGNKTDSLQIRIRSLREIIAHYADETDVPAGDRPMFVDHLLTLFYGIPFQLYTGGIGNESLSDAYRRHLDFVLETPPKRS